ncbi:hypothetical protein D3C75_971150 [compost metagenome]
MDSGQEESGFTFSSSCAFRMKWALFSQVCRLGKSGSAIIINPVPAHISVCQLLQPSWASNGVHSVRSRRSSM